MARGGGGDATPKGFSVYLVNGGGGGGLLLQSNLLAVLSPLAFVYDRIFQVGATVLALKLDKERVLGGGAVTPSE